MSNQLRLTIPEGNNGGAVVSDCRRYRYSLWRHWDGYNPMRVLWIMLNPSTADGTKDDPTIRKCTGFSKRWGYGGMTVVNMFAFRATKPRDMYLTCIHKALSPIGPENDSYLVAAVKSDYVGFVVLAWGASGGREADIRGKDIAALVRFHERTPRCLGLSKHGSPRHPLMLSYDTELTRFPEAT